MRYLLAFLLVIASAAATLNISVVNHNTDVQTTYNNLKACSCGSVNDEFIVKNLGDLAATYIFQVESDKPWTMLEQNSVYLLPGQSTNIHVITSPPCGSIGIDTYTIYVASEYGRYRALHKAIETGVCENIFMNITPSGAEIMPCGSQQFNMTLSNVATFSERYTVSGLGFGSATLDGGETTTLTGWYNASCSEYGTKDIPVTVTSENNKLSQTQIVSINVPRAYDYNIALGDISPPVCAGVISTVPVTFTNVENRDNTYELETAETKMNLVVPAKQNMTIQLAFYPKEAGNQTFSIEAVGLNGSIEKAAAKSISVEACYGYTLQAPNSVNTCAGSVYIPFTITSVGDQTQYLSFDVQSNATTHIDSLKTTLAPGEQLDKTLGVDVPDADRQYYVTLIANSSQNYKKATTLVNGYSTESCYNIKPENTKFQVWTDQEVLPVVIKQIGIQPATYTVSYEGNFMTPVEKNITLGPGGEAVLHFTINSTGYETGRYVDRLTLSTAGKNYTSDFEIQLRQKGFWENFVDQCRWNGQFGVCSATSSLSALILLIVVLLVLGIAAGLVHYENPTKFSRETAGIVGGAILIILLIIMIMTVPVIPRSYERPVQPYNESALFYEIGQDQVLTLDLNRYFFDPDNDNLSFTANQPSDLYVKIDKNTAQIRGKDDFNGRDTLVFTANDGKGGLTDSGLITISVVPYKPVTFLEYWIRACWFITALFLFIAVTLALLTMLFLKDVKPLQERRHVFTLYRRPRTHIIHGEAHDLVEKADTSIKTIPPGTTIGQVIGTQVIQQAPQENLYVASSEGIKFHHIKCPFVKAMPKDKRLTFNSKEEAIKAGYTPCKTCSSHA